MPDRITFFLFFVLSGLPFLASQAQELYPMRNYNKWGYINSEGRWVIQPRYQMAMDFHEGYAIVKDTYQGGEVWDIINEKGQKVIQSEYYGYGVFLKLYDYRITILPNQMFSEGLIPASIEILDDQYSGDPVSGYLNTKGELELYGYFEKVYNFSEGLACVVRKGKYGFIDRNGRFVIQPTFLMAGSFSEGLAPAMDQQTNLWGYINTKGEWAIAPQFSKARDFSDGLAAVWKDFQWGYITPTGHYAIPAQYRVAESFHNGYAYVTKENKSYFINLNGKRAFTDDLYRQLCFTRSFTNGAALLAVAPADRTCLSFELAEDVILHDSNLLLYMNDKGKIFYQQDLDEYYAINKIRP
jgi:hypothetical protein